MLFHLILRSPWREDRELGMCIANVPIEVVFSEKPLDGVAAAVIWTEESSRWCREVGIVAGEPMAIEVFSECETFGMIFAVGELALVRSDVPLSVFTR